ncbi:hypothetical protein CT0861_13250 [Colletotrichum tofieldiae]|uniref:Uncharacterized protein n=1 Tax=Colletotrichum tofieldiae TaxID=708197 RepID=A0A166U7N2_9PEZI|nr:hypothetical protein CT0861_13250 [Colletotrichum tofieldiae]
MEQFGLAAAHSGAINHIHAIHFGPAAVEVIREVRLAVTVVVIGWVAVTGIRTFFDPVGEREASKSMNMLLSHGCEPVGLGEH